MQGNDTLWQTVWGLAEADPELTDDAKLAVLAAMESDSALASLLDGTGGALPQERTGAVEPASEPVGAFLKSITVTSFRGIGRQASLTLHPAPGLTVIAGRNGSGKSSFAEALEMALTGNSYRWKTKKSTVWREAWRNIHDGSDAHIRIRIAEEGAGDTTVGMDWAPDGGLEDRNVWVQRRGKPRQPGLDSLGWESALEVFRPILSYDELGGLLESGPSGLYDALAAMLGLEQVTDAQKRLDAAVKRLGEPRADAKALRTELKQTLTGMDDPRAATALTLLKKQHPDIDAVESLATGTVAAPADDLAGLRAITRIQVPHAAEVRQITEALREATDALVVSSTETVDLAERRTALLRDAVALHEQHGQMPCPVCGVGTLDEPWLTRAQTELSGEDDRLRELRQARERLAARRRAVAELVGSVSALPSSGRFELASRAAAEAAWTAWSRAPMDAAGDPGRMEILRAELAAAVGTLREEAAEVLTRHDDAWTPVATRLAEWVARARDAQAKDHMLTMTTHARDWVKRNAERLRNERLAPLADQARQIWAELRQESNVDLGAITLDGQKNRRRVTLRAQVDGTQADSGLAVLSQGELHALALALFLPRATATASPLRFVVLDDPIQAMDPAKIDGFVRVLGRLAVDRQVIVLSHDDRLSQTVRRMGVPARLLEVHRAASSMVEITSGRDPADRYLDDALALAHDEQVPEKARRRIVPELCRMALETIAQDVFMARRFTEGVDLSAVEQEWDANPRTRQRVGLAVPGGPESLDRWVTRAGSRSRALWICGSATHEGLAGDPIAAIEDVKKTVEDLREGRS